MASEHDPVNWIIPAGESSTTIVFLEPTRNLDVYLAIHRIANGSNGNVIVTTAEGSSLTLLAQQENSPPSTVDVSSSQITIEHQGRFGNRAPLTGTYQLLCCSVGRTATVSRNTTQRKNKQTRQARKRKALE
jgi:hypothetical protein